MFLGEYKHTLTKGNRLALPSKMRSAVTGGEIVLARGFEHCIFGYERLTWEEMAQVELEKPVSSEEGRRIRRQLFAGAISAEIDDQGRFVFPQNLRDYAQIEEAVLVVGAGDHFEIWSEKLWREYLKKIGSDEKGNLS